MGFFLPGNVIMHIRPSLSIYPEFQSFAILRFQTFRDGASLSWLVLACRTPLDAACRETSSSKYL
ncbi:hypothetical protein TWF191_005653 [Orbilia oligospora]|uniref:Uncharacterized protein n=1 Tax=Orbilia oligospora TaxID=2813651 RepID=A0A7C8VGB3_ORBOL|nr:hypothetical protein TWF191_005653 [Orbilia oligospora]